MKFGQVLERVMKDHEITQCEAASVMHLSNSMVSKISNGTRRPAKDTMQLAVRHFDSAPLALAAADEVTGGAYIPWLNKADLHPASVTLKSREEIIEAYEAIGAAPVTKRPDQLKPHELGQIEKAIMESIEAATALYHEAAVLCEAFGFSFTGMWSRHRAELKANKYIE